MNFNVSAACGWSAGLALLTIYFSLEPLVNAPRWFHRIFARLSLLATAVFVTTLILRLLGWYPTATLESAPHWQMLILPTILLIDLLWLNVIDWRDANGGMSIYESSESVYVSYVVVSIMGLALLGLTAATVSFI